MFPGGSYVVAALVFVLAICGAGFTGWHERGKQADAEISAIKSGLEAKVAQAQKLAAETSERVVIRYKDRVKIIHETAPEVEHDVQVIRQSDCTLPAEFVRLHNAGAGVPGEASSGTDDSADSIGCAEAAEVIQQNYQACRVDQERLSALQEWAKGVSQ